MEEVHWVWGPQREVRIPVLVDSLNPLPGSVPIPFQSLLRFGTGGLNWEDLVNPLRQVSGLAVVLVMSYITLTIFAILNATQTQRTNRTKPLIRF